MKTIEESLYKGIHFDNELVFSSFGILGERSGTGKTVTMLAHISQMSTPSPVTHTLHPASTSSFFSIVNQTHDLLPTLIVVPHSLFHQWQKEISKTRLSCHVLKCAKDIELSAIHHMKNSHITLVSNTLLPALVALINHEKKTWTRVVYDEADIIRIPAQCPFVSTRISWLITSRYKNITHANQQIHSHVVKQLDEDYIDGLSEATRDYIQRYINQHPLLTLYKTVSDIYFKSIVNNTHPLRGYFVVTTETSHLYRSISLPPVLQSTLQCKASLTTMSFLDQGNIEDAVLSIHPNILTMDTLLSTTDANVKARLEENKSCSICYESEVIVPCITPCCMNLFCGKCILKWFHINMNCPLCQTVLNPTSLIKVKTEYSPVEKTKQETLRELLRIPDRQTIVFSRNAHDLYTTLNMPSVDILHGNKSTIATILNDFAVKKLNTLIVSDDTTGVDLHSATHMILFDTLRGEEDILGLAQRIGRQTPLVVIELVEH